MISPAKTSGPFTAPIWLFIMAAVTIFAAVTGIWVLTAIPIGFLFGFFLEKADLCGSSAFSEILLMGDSRKFQGLMVVVVTSMVGFALLDVFGLIRLNPKPFLWASYLVGGVLFGVGMVLAGGCISGSLFKTGQGNMNSMAALVAIPLGVAAVEYGPLNAFHTALKQHVINATGGEPLTLSIVTGLSYQALAVILLIVTVTIALITKRKKSLQGAGSAVNKKPLFYRILRGPWKPWQAGIAIGVLAALAYLSSAESGRNYPLGVTHGVLHAELLVTDYPVKQIWTKVPPKPPQTASGTNAEPSTNAKPGKKISWWLILEVVALVVGSNVSARLRGNLRLAPKPPDEVIFAFLGGLLAGSGAAIAGGCVVGNIMSGFALMSLGNVLFGVVAIVTNWITTYFYMMGGQWGR